MHCLKAHITFTYECQTCKANYFQRVINEIKKQSEANGHSDITKIIENMDNKDYLIENK